MIRGDMITQPVTEQELREALDPQTILEATGDVLAPRTVRLFALRCCRTLSRLLLNDSQIKALSLAESHANGMATNLELERAALGLIQQFRDSSDVASSGVYECVILALYHDSFQHLYTNPASGGPFVASYSRSAFDPWWSYALHTSIQVADVLARYLGLDRDSATQEPFSRLTFATHTDLLRELGAGENLHRSSRPQR